MDRAPHPPRACRLYVAVSIACTLAAGGCAIAPPPAPEPSGPAPTDAEAWVRATVERLPLRRKVAQLVFPRIGGAFLPAEGEVIERIRRWIVDDGVGGVIATVGPPLEAAATFNLLQGLADVPLLVTADMEHGPGQLLNGGVVLPWGFENGTATRFPPAMGLAATGDPRFAWELGRVTALEGRAVGVHMTFAPVVDVNNNPDNPIINTRSYGADPALVARFAAAHIRGLREHGMLATAKHFPGHGDTGIDSHIDLPIITVTKARADSIELAPYRVAFEAGVQAVMTAHIAFPALTGDSVPATLSPRILTGLLREELGFDGLVVTDALDMGAIVRRYGAREAPVLALQAGADLLLQIPPDDVGTAIDAIVDAVRRGHLSESRIDASVRRLLRAKAALGLHRERTVDLAAVPYRLARSAHLAVAQEAADRSITVVRDRERLLPLRARRVLSIVYAGDRDPFTGRTFQRLLAERVPLFEAAMVDSSATDAALEALRERALDADAIVFAPFIRVGAYRAGLSVTPSVAALVAGFARTRPTVVVSFGSPYVLGQFPEVGTYVVAWGQWEAPQRAAARALAGQVELSGRLPAPIPPWHAAGDGVVVRPATADPPVSPRSGRPAPGVGALPRARPQDVGMSEELTTEIDRILHAAVLEGATPGAAVAVGRHGRIVHMRGYGATDLRRGAPAVTDSTIWDLASLTKVVGTTTAIMLLADEDRVDLNAPVSRYIEEFVGEPAKEAVTVRHLLLHNGGLPAWEPLWQTHRGRAAFVRAIAATPLRYPPGTETVYSDLGAILLGTIVERVTGMGLDAFLQDRVFGPLGMRETGFNPIDWPVAPRLDGNGEDLVPLLDRVAPTEVDTVFRRRHVHGTVHDENAHAMGGVAGHAGLFSSVRDLAVFAQMLLDGGRYGGLHLIEPATVRAFTRRQASHSSRALGWDTPSRGSSAGDFFSARSYGHTGFTGTSIWIDPERDVFLILLTNRLNPSRENQRHVALRRNLADLVQKAIRDQRVERRPD
jgi:beta-N-acetylhexosaminidase